MTLFQVQAVTAVGTTIQRPAQQMTAVSATQVQLPVAGGAPAGAITATMTTPVATSTLQQQIGGAAVVQQQAAGSSPVAGQDASKAPYTMRLRNPPKH